MTKAEQDKQIAATIATAKETEDVKLRKAKADAETAEHRNRVAIIDLAKAKGDVVLLEDVVMAFQNYSAHINRRLLQIPSKHGGDIVGLNTAAEGKARLQTIINNIISELAETTAESLLKKQFASFERESKTPAKQARAKKRVSGKKGVRTVKPKA